MSKLGLLVDKPVHSIPQASDELVIPLAKIGIEVELESWDGKNLPKLHWDKHVEGSLREGGVEFVTLGAGICGVTIRAALEELFTMARKHKWSEGIPRAGIHIHLDVTDLDGPEQLARLVCNYMLLEHIFFGFSEEGYDTGMRRECGYCVPYSQGQIDFENIGNLLFSKLDKRSFQLTAKSLSKYQALNLNPLVRYGTIEFRHLPTTFDVERVMFWINMILSLKRSAQDATFDEPLKLMSSIGPEDYARTVFGNKIYATLAKYLDPIQMWEAVDNAQTIMVHGGAIKPAGLSWKTKTEPSQVLAAKLNKIGTKKASAKKAAQPDVAGFQEAIEEAALNVLKQKAAHAFKAPVWQVFNPEGND